MLGKLLKYDLRSMLKTISLFWAAAQNIMRLSIPKE